MAPFILSRDESPSAASAAPTINKAVYITGFTVAGLLVTAIFLWLALRYQRRRMAQKRCEEREGAFLHVRGVVRPMEQTNPSSTSTPDTFSRDRMTPSVVLPEKTITRKPNLPGSVGRAPVSSQPGSPVSSPSPRPRPRVNALSSSSRTRTMSTLNPAHPHHSRSSSGFSGYSQLRFPPGLHSRESSLSSNTSPLARPVRQLFEPVLPDELSLARQGECLTVLQSFDDGWCLVARDTSRLSRSSLFNPSRLSSRMKSSGDNIELGLVPAWVFVKPMKGLTVARPVRSASVNVLQTAQDGEAPSREAVLSWSNFA
ncbi:hypothetical protein HYDPIDRAFT_85470 [Hydnomerulius pinastri MD-312]|nr:hypothetical protein HYDPIDRAFT_85470 [Hydnomerulius pinastri MD-312]